MNPLQKMVLIGEIVLQSKIAFRAAERLQDTSDKSDQVEVWCSIQSILCAAGNISKILKPINKDNKARGEKLRQLLKIEDSNPLLDRTFRNHFEHYDDRIEEYFSNSSQGVYIDLAMNPSISGRELNSHRGYNSFNNTLLFRGEVLDLKEILKALEEILGNCSAYVIT